MTQRVALVTGGIGGLGTEICRHLARSGRKVVAADLGTRAERLAEFRDETADYAQQIFFEPLNVTDLDACAALAKHVEQKHGAIDILVNAAGITSRQPTLDMDETRWREILDTNFTGTLRACRTFGRDMVARGYGRIINIGSLTSVVALYEVAAYGASKAAVASLTKSLAIEWARAGVCVNAILPGVFRTALNAGLLDGTERGKELLMRTPMARFGDVDDLVGAAIFLASESARFVTGQLLAVDGGFLASGVNQ